MTPIRCFRVKELELYSEDWSGERTLIATCPDQKQLEWLVSCMVTYHNRKVLQWDDPDSKI